MHIAFVSTIRFPTEKAHGYQIARVCDALHRQGHTVTLYVPYRKNHITTPWHSYYDIRKSFDVVTLTCPDFTTGRPFFDRIAFVISQLCVAFWMCFKMCDAHTVFITRDTFLAFTLSWRRPTFFNAHKGTFSRRTRILLSRVRGVICNSEGTRASFGTWSEKPSVVVHNAADRNPYLNADVSSLRKELNLPENICIALYSGHLYGWKGVDTMLRAAREARDQSEILWVIVGGLADQVVEYKRKYHDVPAIIFLGHKLPHEIPQYLRAADILIIPNSATTQESSHETSPLKLFEYMNAGRPIIASHIPSLTRILGDVGVYVTPGDAIALRDAVLDLSHLSATKRDALSHALIARGSYYTWDAHARTLAVFIERCVTV
jgi:glycosyltransferase involved in cell wall biosynthesis